MCAVLKLSILSLVTSPPPLSPQCWKSSREPRELWVHTTEPWLLWSAMLEHCWHGNSGPLTQVSTAASGETHYKLTNSLSQVLGNTVPTCQHNLALAGLKLLRSTDTNLWTSNLSWTFIQDLFSYEYHRKINTLPLLFGTLKNSRRYPRLWIWNTTHFDACESHPSGRLSWICVGWKPRILIIRKCLCALVLETATPRTPNC